MFIGTHAVHMPSSECQTEHYMTLFPSIVSGTRAGRLPHWTHVSVRTYSQTRF